MSPFNISRRNYTVTTDRLAGFFTYEKCWCCAPCAQLRSSPKTNHRRPFGEWRKILETWMTESMNERFTTINSILYYDLLQIVFLIYSHGFWEKFSLFLYSLWISVFSVLQEQRIVAVVAKSRPASEKRDETSKWTTDIVLRIAWLTNSITSHFPSRMCYIFNQWILSIFAAVFTVLDLSKICPLCSLYIFQQHK